MKRAVFFDRDGVLNEAILVNGQPTSPHTLDEFKIVDGLLRSLARLKEAAFLLIVITNQPDLARGKITREKLDILHDKLMTTLPLDDLFICPHDDADNCHCRKPKPGMLIDAAKKWDVDLASSVVIGDRWREIAAGRAVGCKTILIDATYNRDAQPDFRVKDIQHAVNIALSLV